MTMYMLNYKNTTRQKKLGLSGLIRLLIHR